MFTAFRGCLGALIKHSQSDWLKDTEVGSLIKGVGNSYIRETSILGMLRRL